MTLPFRPDARATAVVTGASGGIGEALARILSAEGYDLVLVARNAQKLAALEAELEAKDGVRVLSIAADLSDPAAPEAVVKRIEQAGGTPEILVNNAGVGLGGAFADTSWEREAAMIRLNVVALVELTKRLLPMLKRRGRGKILNIASVAGVYPGPYMAVYYATKAFVVSFSEALAVELEDQGITVTCLCPGATHTSFETAAGVGETVLFRGPNVMTADRVARIGYEAMRTGRGLVGAGWFNHIQVRFSGLLPTWFAARITGKMNRPAQ